jgi:hypothetical protein
LLVLPRGVILDRMTFDAISAANAAVIIGCTPGRVRQLAREGLLRSIKIGERVWAVSRVDAEKLALRPAATGRPRKFAVS